MTMNHKFNQQIKGKKVNIERETQENDKSNHNEQRNNSDSKKKIYQNFGIIIFLVSLLMVGFTLAYYSYTDVVTNKHSSQGIRIELLEPSWYLDTGMQAAGKQAPGMIITKDPYVYNDSRIKVYVRMKIQILDEDGKELKDKGLVYAYLNSIYWIDENEENEDNKIKLLFNFDEDLQPLSSNHPSFEYNSDDGWFYYKEDGKYIELDVQESTPKLFDEIHIPVLKSEYDGIFDSNYSIKVTAQAVSTEYGTDEETIINAFKKQYKEP